MKRIIQTLIMSVCSVLAFAQTNEFIVLELADGTIQKLNINDVVKITFESEGNDDPTIDESFIPPITYLVGIWNGEYEGWDATQQVMTKIKRELTLYPDGRYTNIIGGQIPYVGRDTFLKFEAEGGTWTYQDGTVTYICQYDSILNFRDQSYTVYTKKHYYDHEADSYNELARFTYEHDGLRGWVTQDNNLQVSAIDKRSVVYVMNKSAELSDIKKGTLDNPYTASEAHAYAASLEANQQTEDFVYVKGFISEIQEVAPTYGNATYYIADSQTSENAFYIYRGHYLQNELFTDEDQIKVGDEVILYARLTNYRGTLPETVTGECYIYSLNGKITPTPNINYFEEPYTQWDANPDMVKSEMSNRGYTLYEDGQNSSGLRYLAYFGKKEETASFYTFNAQQILAEIDIAFFDDSVEELEDFVTTQWGYTFVGKTSDDEDVFATPDNNSYVIIYSSALSDGSTVTFVSYIKRTTASAMSLDRGHYTGPDILEHATHGDASGNLQASELYKHLKASRGKAVFMQK